MAAKKDVYITIELDWSEEQLSSWKAYIDAHPMHELVDRIEWKPLAKGGTMPMVIASIEQQGKFIQETLKNYLALLAEVKRLREVESKKIETRGSKEVAGMASEWLKGK